MSSQPPECNHRPAARRRFQFTGSLLDSSLYVERVADRELLEALRGQRYCHVLAPRQIGKSSLRARIARILTAEGNRCASIDLTAIGTATTSDEWYFGLLDEVARRLAQPDPIEFWEAHRQLAPARRWTRYLLELGRQGSPLVVLIDEIEAVRLVPFLVDDFFTSLRALFEARGSDQEARRITFCLLGVTTPSDLVQKKEITPFNISQEVVLEDFSRSDLQMLELELQSCCTRPDVLVDAIHSWTDGHPYMTMRICSELAEQGTIIEGQEAAAVRRVVQELFLARPLEDANLGYANRRFEDPNYEKRDATLTDKVLLYHRLLRGEVIEAALADAAQMELRLAGMVKARDGRLCLRNQIFATIFDEHWLRAKGDRRFLAESVWKWLDTGRDGAYLLRGRALAQALVQAQGTLLSSQEKEFLAASQRHEQEELEERRQDIQTQTTRLEDEKEKLREQTEKQRSRFRRTFWTLGTLITLFVAAMAILLYYTQEAGRAFFHAKEQLELAQEETRTLQEKNRDITAEILSRASTIDNLRGLVASLTSKLKEQETKLRAREERQTELESRLLECTGEVQTKKVEAGAWSSHNEILSYNLRMAQLENDRLGDLVVRLNRDVKARDATTASCESQRTELRTEVQRLEVELTRLREQLAALQEAQRAAEGQRQSNPQLRSAPARPPERPPATTTRPRNR